jgi:hypothetical protein
MDVFEAGSALKATARRIHSIHSFSCLDGQNPPSPLVRSTHRTVGAGLALRLLTISVICPVPFVCSDGETVTNL